MSATNLHIVLSCTNRKRVGALGYPRLRDVAAKDVDLRAAQWIDRISGATTHSPARDLYAGEFWRCGLDLIDTAGEYGATEAWVLSAGLGLVNVVDPIPPYAATLSSGHPDSVVFPLDPSAKKHRRRWWSALSLWPGPVGDGRPRALVNLATDKNASVVVCAGPDYLEAVNDDLLAALAMLGSERLLVFGSSGAPAGLESSWVQVPGRLRLRFGGTMATTGVRVAAAVMREFSGAPPLGAKSARDLVASWHEATPPLPHYDRKRIPDEDIKRWIDADLAAHGSTNRSTALRRLRTDGLACEQSRFGRLYEAAVRP